MVPVVPSDYLPGLYAQLNLVITETSAVSEKGSERHDLPFVLATKLKLVSGRDILPRMSYV